MRDALTAAVEERAGAMRHSEFTCVVCGERIRETGCTTDLLTTESDHPLRGYSYMHFHRAHLRLWRELAAFENAVEAATLLGRWEGSPTIALVV
jgi:hypothetical protein